MSSNVGAGLPGDVWELYSYLLPQNGVEWGWCISFVPPALLLLGVHILFRNIFTIMWFFVKVIITGIVYMHIKTLVSSAVLPYSIESVIFGGSSDWKSANFLPFGESLPKTLQSYSFESVVFGIPTGTLQEPLHVAFQILRAKSLLMISSICPKCFATPLPPIPPPLKMPSRSPWVDWIGDHNGL
jgi:hypothetical protein